MPSSRGLFRLQRSIRCPSLPNVAQHRCASLTSAIERGIRTGKRGVHVAEKRRLPESNSEASSRFSKTRGSQERDRYGTDRDALRRTGNSRRATGWPPASPRERRPWQTKQASADDVQTDRPTHRRRLEGERGNYMEDSENNPRIRNDSFNRKSSELPSRVSRRHDNPSYTDVRRDLRENHNSRDRERPSHIPRDNKTRYDEDSPDSTGHNRYGTNGRKEFKPYGKINTHAPLAVPYTTAGSEFVYGLFSVKAALQSGRRKLYKLYILMGEDSERDRPQDTSIQKLALAAGVRIMEVGGDWNRLLTKMSGTRPHNGYVLEASPIPKLPITALQTTEQNNKNFVVDLAHQSEEELAVNGCFAISGNEATLKRQDTTRFPLVLMLDRILDPGNLGAIIRSAHFLGADAVIVVDHGTSPFSAVTIKSSAGAAESFPILSVQKEHEFIKTSQANGWKFFAATSPDSASSIAGSRRKSAGFQIRSVLKDHPCVLMLGNEGEGLRPQLQKRADSFASIANARGSQQGLESLNVSVAAALLLQDFFKDLKHVQAADTGSRVHQLKDDEAVF